MQARSYRPDIGRFTSTDSYEQASADLQLQSDPLTQNRYAFAGGNPIGNIEWDGHDGHPQQTQCRNSGKSDKQCAKQQGEVNKAQADAGRASAPSDTAIVLNNSDLSPEDKATARRKLDADPERAAAIATMPARFRSVKVREVINGPGRWCDPFCGALDTVYGVTLKPGVDAIGGIAKCIGEGCSASEILSHVATLGSYATGPVGRAAGASRAGTTATRATRGAPRTNAQRASLSCAKSFGAETLVLMADGTKRPISKVRVGDYVLATDPKTGKTTARIVTHTWVHQDTVYRLRLDGETLTTTEDHPIWNDTDQQWQRADELDRGEQLLSPDRQPLIIRGLDADSAHTALAYNLTVHAAHTYHVGTRAALVHNTGDCGPVLTRRLDRSGRPLRDVPPAQRWQTDELASNLGYSRTRERVRNQPVYRRGRSYIVQDIDSHNGGFWKMAPSVKALKSKDSRSGSYDFLLQPIGG